MKRWGKEGGSLCIAGIVRWLGIAFLAWAAATDARAADAPAPDTAMNLDMPPPLAQPGNTYARGMSSLLAYLGAGLDYDQVMGLTGLAFILQIDISGPYIDGELDCAWWPNDAWGLRLGLPVLSQAAGWEMHGIHLDFQDDEKQAAEQFRQTLEPAIRQSLVAGRPALAEHDHGFIITAMDSGKPPLIGYLTQGKSTQFLSHTRIDGYPWGAIVLGKEIPRASPGEIDLASLRHIIALFHEQALPPGAASARFTGRRAWLEWQRLLREGKACDNNMLIHLRYNRGSAVVYLRDMAGRHDGEAAEHLNAAAALYEEALDHAKRQPLPYASMAKGGEAANNTLTDFTAMVERISRLEANAVVEIEAAVASILH